MDLKDVMAAVGAITGVASLTWNAASFALTGARAKVTIATGLRTGSGGLYLMPTPKEGVNIYDNPIGGTARPVLVVQIFGKGRQGITIDEVRLVTKGRLAYLPGKFLDGAPPARLDIHASHRIVLPLNELNLSVHSGLRSTFQTELRLRAIVYFGNGKVRRSKAIRFYQGHDPQIVEQATEPETHPSEDD